MVGVDAAGAGAVAGAGAAWLWQGGAGEALDEVGPPSVSQQWRPAHLRAGLPSAGHSHHVMHSTFGRAYTPPAARAMFPDALQCGTRGLVTRAKREPLVRAREQVSSHSSSAEGFPRRNFFSSHKDRPHLSFRP